MALPTITPQTIITGGAISLDITSDTSVISLERSADGGSTWTTLVSSGAIEKNQSFYIDVGDNLNRHLDFTTSYTYRVTDANGTATTPGIVPSASISVQKDELTYIMIRLVQAALDSIILPEGFIRADVLGEMPLSRTPKLPLVTINMDLVQQEHVPIGRNVPDSMTNQWTVPGTATRRFSVWVLAEDTATRNFYHDAIIGLFGTIMSTAFSQNGINMDISYRYQATQGASTGGQENPGFYYSQIMLDMTGPLNIGITTDYGTPSGITLDITITGQGNISVPSGSYSP